MNWILHPSERPCSMHRKPEISDCKENDQDKKTKERHIPMALYRFSSYCKNQGNGPILKERFLFQNNGAGLRLSPTYLSKYSICQLDGLQFENYGKKNDKESRYELSRIVEPL